MPRCSSMSRRRLPIEPMCCACSAIPRSKPVAEKAGLDLRRATTAVASLEGQELTQLAAQARQVDEALAGGQSKVVISTTVIIIILLVLILLIVAID